ncbi:MAG: ABC transporter permease [Actinomycetaceae bacterium]|nr:ABC transporter permease [Actinomycetaceae bacterium]
MSRFGVTAHRLGIALCLIFATVVGLAALFPTVLAPADPLATYPTQSLIAPNWEHPFGTDESGRDIWTRVIHGAKPALTIGVSATAIGMGLGTILGVIGGMAAGRGRAGVAIDWTTARVVEILYALPGILLALLVLTFTGPGVIPATFAVGLATAPGYSRMIRASIRSVRNSDYVRAEIILGRSPARILFRTIIPNALRPLTALATLGIGQAVVWAGALSYIGLGPPPPSPEWGAMLKAGNDYLQGGMWWLTVFPGAAIASIAVVGTILSRLIDRERGLSHA